MTKLYCDACSKEISIETREQGYLRISLEYLEVLSEGGHTRNAVLCHRCTVHLFELMGLFCDAGKILSKAKGESLEAEADIMVRNPGGNIIEF